MGTIQSPAKLEIHPSKTCWLYSDCREASLIREPLTIFAAQETRRQGQADFIRNCGGNDSTHENPANGDMVVQVERESGIMSVDIRKQIWGVNIMESRRPLALAHATRRFGNPHFNICFAPQLARRFRKYGLGRRCRVVTLHC